MDMISVDQVTKDYGSGRGVFDISFQVKQGECLGFLGPNGAGKTTMIRQLMGFTRPDRGQVRICGMDCFKEMEKIQKMTGYLPGEIAFMDQMRGIDFIHFVANLKGMTDLTGAKGLMERFELDATGKIRRMSKGMKQKIAIVCAFMAEPELLILDEPTGGLDPLMQNRFVELILEETKKGKTILMSSHIFEEVEKTCSRSLIIKKGHIICEESMDQLKQLRSRFLEISFANAEMATAFSASCSDDKLLESKDPHTVILRTGKDLDQLIKQMGKYTITDLKTRTESLEDVFLQFYGDKEMEKEALK